MSSVARRPLRLWPELFGWPELREMLPWAGTAEQHRVRIEQYLDGDDLVIRAELPGVKRDDVTVSLGRGYLSIQAERSQEEKAETRGGYRSEFHYGAFTRQVSLPWEVTDKDVTASYKDGILEVRVHLPKTEQEPGPNRVPITEG